MYDIDLSTVLSFLSQPTGLLFGDWPVTVLVVWLSLILDWWLGEPRRYHPLVGYGYLIGWLEKRLNASSILPNWQQTSGLLAWIIAVLPLCAIAYTLALVTGFSVLLSIVLLYAAVGHRSLHEHVWPIADAIEQGNEAEARYRASMIVSRDPAEMDIAKSTVESTLENGSDGVFAALFWFLLAGAPGVLLYRLANTLDASWGYKNRRYLHFGRASAMIDDLLNYMPARLTALTYAVFGRAGQALRCWQQQAGACSSPNGGPVMAAGAGSLNISVGGPACYHGKWIEKPTLGAGPAPAPDDIRRALTLVRHSCLLWLFVISASLLWAAFYA